MEVSQRCSEEARTLDGYPHSQPWHDRLCSVLSMFRNGEMDFHKAKQQFQSAAQAINIHSYETFKTIEMGVLHSKLYDVYDSIELIRVTAFDIHELLDPAPVKNINRLTGLVTLLAFQNYLDTDNSVSE